MHEMGIAQQVIQVAMEALANGPAEAKVEVLNLKVGRLTAVVPDSLRFCFDIVSQGTLLAGARLAIEEVPIVVRCRDCGAETTIEKAHFICAACQGKQLEVISGRELVVSSLEVAD